MIPNYLKKLSRLKDTAESTFQDIKSNAEKISSTITDKAGKLASEIAPVASALGDKVKEKAEEFGRNVKDVAQAIAEEVKDSQAKPHKVIMLGGRRAGKSSLLACIIDQLSSRTPGNICTAVQIDQAHEFYSETGEAYAMPPLSEKKDRNPEVCIKT